MAKEENKEANKEASKESEYYTTKPNTQLDLEARLDENGRVKNPERSDYSVNPNPFGEEEYVGTDPIYQNYANDQMKPLAAEDGVERSAEEGYKEMFNLDDLDDDEVAEDYGTGGKAQKARANADAGPTVWKVPGQEGYPEDDSHDGPARPVQQSTSEATDADKDKNEGVATANNPGTNMGASTQKPNENDGPRAGDKPATKPL